MGTLTTADFVLRLAVGLGCGALIGVERQWRARMAGLRTNALVAAGATLFVLYQVVSGSANTTQVAAYVVSGVGFLGGGVILRDGFNVRGLNTAATLWCSAAVGVLSASGHLAFAGIATAAVLATHLLGRPIGRLIDRDNPSEEDEDLRPYLLHVDCRSKDAYQVRTLLVQNTGGGEVILHGISTEPARTEGDTRLTAELLLGGDAPAKLEQLVARLSIEKGINAVHWHTDDDEPEPLRPVAAAAGDDD